MKPVDTFVIVGGGLAGAKAIEGARGSGFAGRVLLIGAEPHLPYERPPLSKDVLRGDAPGSSAEVAGEDFIKEHAVDIITGTAVDQIDLVERRVRLEGASGAMVPFDALLLATGSAPRPIRVPGADLEGVHYLRTLEDAETLRAAIRSGARVAVIGAGWIGTEVAASARQMGAEVVMIDPGEVPLQRPLGSEIGEVFRSLHADHGVELRMGAQVTELRGTGRVEQVVLGDQTEPADVVVVGIGVEPVIGLAKDAGLEIDNGILVNEYLGTSAAGVYAAGDVANAFHFRYNSHIRVEHWSNAVHQGTTAGRNATGPLEPYTRLPFFFSDQYDLGMEFVGMNGDADEVLIRGDVRDRKFIAWWHNGGVVSAAMNVNIWDVSDDLRTIVEANARFDPAHLIDQDIAISELKTKAAAST